MIPILKTTSFILTIIFLIMTIIEFKNSVFQTTPRLCSNFDTFCVDLKNNKLESTQKLTNRTSFTLSSDERKVTCNAEIDGLIIEDVCVSKIKELLSNSKQKDIKLLIDLLKTGPMRVEGSITVIALLEAILLFIKKKIIYPILMLISGVLTKYLPI